MLAKTQKVRDLCNLPESETVIQDYYCSYGMSIGGRLYITQNYVIFHCNLPLCLEQIPFRKIADIQKEKNLIGLSNSLLIKTQEKEYSFGSFVHRDETYNLLQHLLKYPPSFIQLDESSHTAQSSITIAPASTTPGDRMSHAGFSDVGYGKQQPARQSVPPDVLSGHWGGQGASGFSASDIVQRKKHLDVDTDLSKQVLRDALEARQMGADTLNELGRQAETIDRIERNVENVHASMDRGERHIRGIESVGGSLKNFFTSDKDVGNRTAYNPVDRRIQLDDKPPENVDLPILLKHSNDFLTPALLRFTEDCVKCVEADPPNRPYKGLSFPYTSFAQFVVRARPQHLDLRFKDPNAPRFRLMSSHIQGIVNELALRCPGGKVLFEPGIRTFQYGSRALCQRAVKVGRDGGGGGMFRAKQKLASNVLSDNVTDQTKAAFDEQDRHLDQLTDVVGDLKVIATGMGTELDRQNQQLEHVTTRVDQANERVFRNNFRVKQLI